MKTFRTILITFSLLLTITPNMAQKKNKNKKDEITALKLYEGPELSMEQHIRIVTVNEKKKYAYFIAVDNTNIPNNSLMDGAKEILLLPGEHSIQLRFVSKGEIAIPIEPLDSFFFEAGKTYLVKFEHTHGKGTYLNSAKNTRIRLWVEENGQEDKLLEKTVNGFGKSLK